MHCNCTSIKNTPNINLTLSFKCGLVRHSLNIIVYQSFLTVLPKDPLFKQPYSDAAFNFSTNRIQGNTLELRNLPRLCNECSKCTIKYDQTDWSWSIEFGQLRQNPNPWKTDLLNDTYPVLIAHQSNHWATRTRFRTKLVWFNMQFT